MGLCNDGLMEQWINGLKINSRLTKHIPILTHPAGAVLSLSTEAKVPAEAGISIGGRSVPRRFVELVTLLCPP